MYIGNVGNIQLALFTAASTTGCMYIGNAGDIQLAQKKYN